MGTDRDFVGRSSARAAAPKSGFVPDFPAVSFAHPVFDPLRPALERLAGEGWPDCARLERLAAELGVAPCTASGHPVRFVAPSAESARYELRVFQTGAVPTRPRNWHDLFNALAWIAYPRAKAAINALHAARIPLEGKQRGSLRDMLTLIDEGGVIVACDDAALVELARGFRWRELFWEQRARVIAGMRLFVIGHAVMEMALAPWPGITCKAMFFRVARGTLEVSPEALRAALDRRAADWLEAHAGQGTPRTLAPLPVFGFPGWLPESARAEFYDDARYFRPFRRGVRGLSASGRMLRDQGELATR
jgi:hypothetical protein